jgi:hypothetical protein
MHISTQAPSKHSTTEEVANSTIFGWYFAQFCLKLGIAFLRPKDDDPDSVELNKHECWQTC